MITTMLKAFIKRNGVEVQELEARNVNVRFGDMPAETSRSPSGGG
jgi:hypothetical protein